MTYQPDRTYCSINSEQLVTPTDLALARQRRIVARRTSLELAPSVDPFASVERTRLAAKARRLGQWRLLANLVMFALVMLVFMSTVACTATVDGTETAPTPDQPDAGMTAPMPSSTPDAAAPVDDPEDLSRCAANAWIVKNRGQLPGNYSAADLSYENYPVNQIRTTFGLGTPFTDQVIAIRVRIPDDYVATDPTHLGAIRVAEAGAQPVVSRALCLSAHACDFSPCPQPEVIVSPSQMFTIESPTPYLDTPNLERGQVVWINLWNRTSEYTSSCPYASCAASIDIASPNRY